MDGRSRTGPVRAALALVASGLLAACSSGGGTGAAAPAGSSAAPSSASSPAATVSATPSSSVSGSATATPSASASATSATPSASPTRKRTRDRALEGTWRADAGAVLAANLAGGRLRGITACTGPIVLTFTAQETLADQGQITCTGTGATAHGQFSSTGRYTADGTRLVVTHAATRCTLSAAGVQIPCGFATSNGTATYRVTGSHLTLTFATSAGPRTQQYVR